MELREENPEIQKSKTPKIKNQKIESTNRKKEIEKKNTVAFEEKKQKKTVIILRPLHILFRL